MKKIEIIDCCNTEHKITMMIREGYLDFVDDVYCALEKHKGLSSKQIKKLEDFRKSCPGPIIVEGYYFSDNDTNYLGGRDFDWTSYDVYEAQGFVFVHYKTSIQGDRDLVVKVAKDEYKGLDAIREDIHTWRSIGQRSFKVVWRGHKIY